MPLDGDAILAIALSCLLCSGAATGLAVLVLARARNAGMGLRFAVVGAASVLALAASVLAIGLQMYISLHDLTVLVWVLGIALVFAILTGWITSRAARTSLERLSAAVERVGAGDVVAPERSGWREIDDLSAQLADVSARLSEAKTELERLDSDRRRFLAWISHDLRTPLTAALALAESMEEGVLEDPSTFPARVRAQVETMGRMVDDLFELSRITSGGVRLRTEQVELLDVVSDAVADVRGPAAARGVRILQRGIAGHTLWVDSHQLTRVVANLLTNSIRHAPEGSDILVSAEERQGRRLALAVIDQGGGVAVEDLDRMFEVGWRADPSRSSEDGTSGVASGAGLGLAIARGLAQAHGGDIYAQHTDEGFRVTVLLPLETSA